MTRALALVAACLASCRAAPARTSCAARADRAPAPASIVADGSFAGVAWDSGPIADRCASTAPWGRAGWGAEAASFRDERGGERFDRRLDAARLSVRDGAARISARDQTGRWSFARFVQGDVWGGSSCGPAAWRGLDPVRAAGGPLALDFDVCLEESELGSIAGSWILVGANVWASSPSMPARGRDRHGRKPLVLDLVVHHRTSMLGVRDGSHEDDVAYHHQVAVAEVAPGAWTHVSVDLAAELRAAVRHFGLGRAWPDLAIEQVELVVEVHDARAAVRVDDVILVRSTGARTFPRRSVARVDR